MNLQIRKATLDDTFIVGNILTDAVNYKLSLDDSSWGSEPFSERETRGLIKTGETYVVLADNKIIATFGLHDEDREIWGNSDDKAWYIHRLAVAKDLHGKGVGEQIIKWIKQQAQQQNIVYLRLDCAAENSKLCNYYEKLGFKLVGNKKYPTKSTANIANLYQINDQS